MFDAHYSRAETDACTVAGLVEGVEIHAAAADRLQCTWAGYRRWKQGLQHVARETAITSGKRLQSCFFAVIHWVATETEGVGGEHVRANSELVAGAGNKKFPDGFLAQPNFSIMHSSMVMASSERGFWTARRPNCRYLRISLRAFAGIGAPSSFLPHGSMAHMPGWCPKLGRRSRAHKATECVRSSCLRESPARSFAISDIRICLRRRRRRHRSPPSCYLAVGCQNGQNPVERSVDDRRQ